MSTNMNAQGPGPAGGDPLGDFLGGRGLGPRVQGWMEKSRRRRSMMGPGCLTLFALPFAAVGVGMGIWALVIIGQSLRARSWVEVPARILQSDLEAHSDSEGGTSYKATARYEYEYLGRTRQGTRISFHGGSDNIGSFQKRVAGELERYRREGKPFPCRVNPADPTESVLYPQVRLEMLGFQMVFVLAFGGAGFGLMIGAAKSRTSARKSAEREAQHPGEPWKWRDDWAAGMIPFTGGQLAGMLTVFAGFWNIVAFPAAFTLLDPANRRNAAAWVVLIFPAVGIALATAAGMAIRRWRTYRGTVFQMASVPGVLGGRLGGAVRVPVHLRPADGFRVSLRCIRKVKSGDSTRDMTIWESETVVTRDLFERDPTRSAIPVVFGIPYDQPPSDPPPGGTLRWELSVHARLPGQDFKATFEVPVFRTPESRADFPADAATVAPGQKPPAADAVFAAQRIEVRPFSSGGRSYYLAPARKPGGAAALTLFCAIWTGAVVLMVRGGAPVGFPIVFGLIDLGVLMGAVSAWFGWKRIEATPGGLTVAGGMLGFNRSSWHPVESLASVKVCETGYVGTRKICGIEVRTSDGRTRRLLGNVGGTLEAEVIAQEIRKDLGLQADG